MGLPQQIPTQCQSGDEILNDAKIGVHLVDGNGTIIWANRCELEMMGYDDSEYFNRSIADFHVDSDVISRILEVLTGGGNLSAYPARLRGKDGSVHHVLINSDVHNHNGEFIHTRCFTAKISEPVYNQLRVELLSEDV